MAFRIATRSASSGGRSLRAPSSQCLRRGFACVAASSPWLGVSERSTIPATATATTTAIASFPLSTKLRTVPELGGRCRGVRLYSTDANEKDKHTVPESKIWDFTQLRKIATSPSKIVIVDTREPAELAQTGRIPGAINIPLESHPESYHVSEQEFEDRFGYQRPDKETEVVFYCKAGVRSRAAAALAKDAGWTNVGEYPGSWLDWKANGGKSQW